jgi:hypothetical protein
VLFQEAIHDVGVSIEDDVDIGVTCDPEILEQRRSDLFGEGSRVIAEQIESLAKWSTPGLIPSGSSAITSTVGPPALDAVSATPGAVVDNFSLPAWWKALEELAVIGEGGVVVVLDPMHGVAERHLAVTVMVAVALAISGDVSKLRLIARLVRVMDIKQALGEIFAGVEKTFEGDRA